MIELRLRPDMEARLVADAQAHGMEPGLYAASLVERSISADLKAAPKTKEEMQRWVDDFSQYSNLLPPLPDDAFTRESFYQDHD